MRASRGQQAPSRPWILAIILAVPAVVLLLDILRPIVFERRILEQVALARIDAEPWLRASDLVFIAAGVMVLATAMWLAATNRRDGLARCVLIMWSSVIAFVAAETVLAGNHRPYVYAPNLALTFHPDPAILPGISGPSHVSFNSSGIRGPEWDPTAYRMLAVGGSTTACLLLDDTEAWPRRLMDILNEASAGRRRFWVGNVGKSGLDSLHHVVLLENLPEASQVDLVLVLAGVNDLSHALRLPYDVRQRLAPGQVFDMGGPRKLLDPLLRQTTLYRSAKVLLGQPASSDLDVEDDTGRVYAVRRELRRKSRKDYPLPQLEPHLADYQRNLARISQFCLERNIRCVFVTQPTMWQDPMPTNLEAMTWFLPFGKTGRTISSPDLARAMVAFNHTLLEMCREQRAECVDLAAAYPKDNSVFYDHEHFNEAGADLFARRLADYFLRTL